jgi:hypothetical protein
LASMVREMDHAAPREIALDRRVEVFVKPTAGVRELADEAELAEDARIDGMTGEGLPPSPGLSAWQSQETVGLFVRILASARKLRPKIEVVIGDGQARDCYVNLHKTLAFRDHTAITHKPTGGFVMRRCMQWRGIDGSVERLATQIEHWHRNLLLLVDGDKPRSQVERGSTLARDDSQIIVLKDFDQTVFDEIAGSNTRVGIEYLVGRLPGFRGADHPDPKTVRNSVNRLCACGLVEDAGRREGITLTPKGRKRARAAESDS